MRTKIVQTVVVVSFGATVLYVQSLSDLANTKHELLTTRTEARLSKEIAGVRSTIRQHLILSGSKEQITKLKLEKKHFKNSNTTATLVDSAGCLAGSLASCGAALSRAFEDNDEYEDEYEDF